MKLSLKIGSLSIEMEYPDEEPVVDFLLDVARILCANGVENGSNKIAEAFSERFRGVPGWKITMNEETTPQT